MKKITLLAALLMMACSGSAFATELTTGQTNQQGTGLTVYGGTTLVAAQGGSGVATLGRLSKGVEIGAAFTTTGYAITTKHVKGTKQFGTANDSTAIYSTDAADGGHVVAPTTNSSTAFNTGYTAM